MVMSYAVILTPQAKDDLRKLDRIIAQRILTKIKWLCENFDTVVPDALTGEFKGSFKLRVGSYRTLYTVNADNHIITIHVIGHRRDIYNMK